jgi:hypothetical protein
MAHGCCLTPELLMDTTMGSMVHLQRCSALLSQQHPDSETTRAQVAARVSDHLAPSALFIPVHTLMQANDTVLRLPRSLIMSIETCQSTDVEAMVFKEPLWSEYVVRGPGVPPTRKLQRTHSRTSGLFSCAVHLRCVALTPLHLKGPITQSTVVVCIFRSGNGPLRGMRSRRAGLGHVPAVPNVPG